MASPIHFNISALFGQLAGISLRHGTFTIYFHTLNLAYGHKLEVQHEAIKILYVKSYVTLWQYEVKYLP